MEVPKVKVILNLILILFLFSSVSYVSGLEAQTGFSHKEDYNFVEENWNNSLNINFEDYWEGDNYWGGAHRVYSIQMDTKEVIAQDGMRKDCLDIRMASEDQLLGTRVQDNTCNTNETWVYFSNPEIDGEFYFDENESIKNLKVFYGNKNAGLSKFSNSVYNDDIATLLKPESAVGMYYGHHTSVYTNQETNLDSNDKDAPEQTWSVDFRTDHGGTGTDNIHISDDDGNSVTLNSGDSYTITSSNAPSWLDQGDQVTVYFTSQTVCYRGCSTDTSNSETAQWGYPVKFENPDPAKSTNTGQLTTTTANLEIDVDDPDGGGVDVSFYNADNDNLIGSDNNVNDGDTASVEWSGLDQAETYRWYAEGCKGSGCRSSSTYEFDINGFPTIESINFDNFTNSHGFRSTALVRDGNGDDDLDDCAVEAEGMDNSITRNPGFDRDTGDGDTAECSFDLNYDEINVNRPLQQINVSFLVFDSKNQDTGWSLNNFPNNNPSVDNIEFTDIPGEHKFNTSVDYSDYDSVNDGEIQSCVFEFSDGDGNEVEVSPTPDYSYGSQGEVKCQYSNINASIPGFEVGEEITVNASVVDRHGDGNWGTTTREIPNNAPYSTVIGPEDEGEVLEFPVDLKIRVNEDDEDNVDVEFFDESGTKLCDRTGLGDGSTVECEWDVSNPDNREYDWEVKLSDNWDSQTGYYSFEKVLGLNPVSNLGIGLNYSSMIVNAGSKKYTEVRVQNKESKEKNLTLSLEGVKSEFIGGSQTKNLPNFDANSQKRYTVRVNPENPQKENFTIIAEDNNLGINTSKSIPVAVLKSSPEENREVPGIGLINILFLVLVSAGLYILNIQNLSKY